MSRSAVPAGRRRGAVALIALLLATFVAPLPARAGNITPYWFAGTRLIFERIDDVDGEPAIGIRDAGLTRFLSRVGATVSWQPGARNVTVTGSDRKTIAFTVGDTRVQDGNTILRSPFAVYATPADAYVPLHLLIHALGVEIVRTSDENVLQPMLGGLDVRAEGRTKTLVTLHSATPIRVKTALDTPQRISLTFSGVASALPPARRVDGPGLSTITIVGSGTAKAPTTTVMFDAPAGAQHAWFATNSPYDVTIGFAPAGVALGGSALPAESSAPPVAAAPVTTVAPQPQVLANNAPPPPPVPRTAVVATAPRVVYTPPPPDVVPSDGPTGTAPNPVTTTTVVPPGGAPNTVATITALDVLPADDGGLNVHVALSGAVQYEWHRLLDNRWYIDLRGAQLSGAGRDDHPNGRAVTDVRVRQTVTGPAPVVRIALTLTGDQRVEVAAQPDGLLIAAAPIANADVARTGFGNAGPGALTVAQAAPVVTTPPVGWKFGANPAATAPPPAPGSNPRLIVIDAGHGGSDIGAAHNGLVEKDLTLDIAMRLRALLVARGWQVRMTRDRDVDVYAPNDTAKEELQARCDVANNAGARLFVSVHINSSTSTAPNGTTTYWYKAQDRSFAAAVQNRLIPLLHTQDDGVRSDILYVLRHTTMPAVLVETAFISNPADAGLMRSPAFLQNVALGIADGIKDYAGAPGTPLTKAGDQ